MRIATLILLSLSFLIGDPTLAAKRRMEVQVADPYMEMYTGPGRGYPVFHVVDRGEWVTIEKRRTDWFKVRTERGTEGWVHRRHMEETLQPTGELTDFNDGSLRDYPDRTWEMGMMGGDFDGADIITVHGSYIFSPNLSIELATSRILGQFSNGYMASFNVVHQFFPEWRVSPFFKLGAGVIHTEPKSTLVQAEDRTDEIGHAGFGIRTYVSRRFIFRTEYNNYVVFTSRDDNEEVEEWKVGFSFFF